MHFCFTAQYTPEALNAIMENPTTNRYEASKKLIEAARGQANLDVQYSFRRPRRADHIRYA